MIPLWLVWVLLGLNSLAAGWLFCYGMNAYWLTAHRRGPEQIPPPLDPWPLVTVQLPIFNELYVAQRLIQAVCALDYPQDRLHIQVLDDSTDETQRILKDQISYYTAQGFSIEYRHRTDRTGYKAGALAAAQESIKGDLVAIFDADFVPPHAWLKQTLPYMADPTVGVVQTRWGHINRDYSLLTRLQALGIDGHFTVEQQCRSQRGYWLNFNGTAGVWRVQAIVDGGGWQADTLAEDMDLSYRAQLRGWRLVYAQHIVTPAELPVTVGAYKLQQYRWAKGSIQCARKLLPRIGKDSSPWGRKIQAYLHLTAYSAHPLMVLILLLSWPLLTVDWVPKHPISMIWGTLIAPATLGPPLLYVAAQRDLYPHTWLRGLGTVVLLAILGTGISLSNTLAVGSALWGKKVQFLRTPKFAVQVRQDRWQNKRYRLGLEPLVLGELALCWYSLQGIQWVIWTGAYGILPFLLLYLFGYGYVAGLTIWQWLQQNPLFAKITT